VEHEKIRYEVRGRTAIITLDDPERLNAWSTDLEAEVVATVAAVNADDALGAIILTGEGRAYCSGADVGSFGGGAAGAARSDTRGEAHLRWIRLVEASKPMVVAFNGLALGSGLTTTLPCDIRIASERATFAAPFLDFGLVPEFASSHFLPRIVGMAQAIRLCLTGERIDAAEALRIGLVHRVVAPEALLEAALDTAEALAGKPPVALRRVRDLLLANAYETDIALVIERERAGGNEARLHPEHEAALEAFRAARRKARS
jgi:2-(1,2-epoxy-1,2-dihydrophenyl)acetyl-CoA isomerase